MRELSLYVFQKKTGLYVSNLKDCPSEGWDELVTDEFIKARNIAKITMSDPKIDYESCAYEHFKKQFPLLMQGFSRFNDEIIKAIVSNLVCIFLNYEYDDMGGWEDNPFDGRLCEKDYSEMIVDFLHFLSDNGNCPFWIYSSNYDEPTPFHKLLWVKNAFGHCEILLLCRNVK